MTRIPLAPTVQPKDRLEWFKRVCYSDKGNAVLNNNALCMANNGNTDGLAKGRCMHLTPDGKKTICSISVENYFKSTSWAGKKLCKICFKNQ